jgi:hypothetical protein
VSLYWRSNLLKLDERPIIKVVSRSIPYFDMSNSFNITGLLLKWFQHQFNIHSLFGMSNGFNITSQFHILKYFCSSCWMNIKPFSTLDYWNLQRFNSLITSTCRYHKFRPMYISYAFQYTKTKVGSSKKVKGVVILLLWQHFLSNSLAFISLHGFCFFSTFSTLQVARVSTS